MKKFIVGLILCGLVIAGFFIFKGDSKDEQKLTKVKVGEVTHSVFYTPQYVAHSLGYFEDEGLDVEILLTAGADKVTAAVLSGDVQIGFCGSESTIYIYEQGEKDYLVNFGALTKAINSNGISSDATDIDTSVEFSSMSGSFIGGNGDFVTLFEPTASELVKQGYGHIVASVGELGGVVPYTAYNAKKSYIEGNPEVIKGFNKAIQKGLDYVFSHSDSEVADVIADYFPDTSKKDLVNIVKNYRDSDSWFTTTYIEEKDFEHIQEIMKNAGHLSEKAPYDKLVDNTFSKER